LEEKVATPVYKIRHYDGRESAAQTTLRPSIRTNFADKRWSLCWYSSLAYSGHGVLLKLASFPILFLYQFDSGAGEIIRQKQDAEGKNWKRSFNN
jgi:hypothetical protein